MAIIEAVDRRRRHGPGKSADLRSVEMSFGTVPGGAPSRRPEGNKLGQGVGSIGKVMPA
jgi:hypothetical protein